jgi:hypothetical protein
MDVGSNPTSSEVVCPGFNVIGSVAPSSLNPTPDTVAPLMRSGAVPVELKAMLRVTPCPFTTTPPNETDVVPTDSNGTTAFNFRLNCVDVPHWLAVRVTVRAVDTGDTAAENGALVLLAGIVTIAGTVTAGSLLDSFTLTALIAGTDFT